LTTPPDQGKQVGRSFVRLDERQPITSLRSTARIARPADEVWKVVADLAGISAWSPTPSRPRPGTSAAPSPAGSSSRRVSSTATRSCAACSTGSSAACRSSTTSERSTSRGRAGRHALRCSTEITTDCLADMIGPSIDGDAQGVKSYLEGSRNRRGRTRAGRHGRQRDVIGPPAAPAALSGAGAPEHLLDTWFAGTLRDGSALAATGSARPFPEVGAAVLTGLLSHVDGLTMPVKVAVAGVQGGVKELQVHPDVPEGLRVLADAGMRVVTLTNGSLPQSATLRRPGRARRAAAVGRRRRPLEAAPGRLQVRRRLLRRGAAAVRDGRRASVGRARCRGGRHGDRLGRPARHTVPGGVHRRRR